MIKKIFAPIHTDVQNQWVLGSGKPNMSIFIPGSKPEKFYLLSNSTPTPVLISQLKDRLLVAPWTDYPCISKESVSEKFYILRTLIAVGDSEEIYWWSNYGWQKDKQKAAIFSSSTGEVVLP